MEFLNLRKKGLIIIAKIIFQKFNNYKNFTFLNIIQEILKLKSDN